LTDELLDAVSGVKRLGMQFTLRKEDLANGRLSPLAVKFFLTSHPHITDTTRWGLHGCLKEIYKTISSSNELRAAFGWTRTHGLATLERPDDGPPFIEINEGEFLIANELGEFPAHIAAIMCPTSVPPLIDVST